MNAEQSAAFALELGKLAVDGRRADRAVVKRARTGHPTQRLLARRVYHQLLPAGVPHSTWNLDLVERVTALFVVNPRATNDGLGLGTAVHHLARRPHVSAEAVERRFIALLGAGPDTLDTHISRLLVRCHGEGIAIDYAQLTRDLAQAGHPDRYIQRRWADQFWAPEPRSTDNTQPEGATQP